MKKQNNGQNKSSFLKKKQKTVPENISAQDYERKYNEMMNDGKGKGSRRHGHHNRRKMSRAKKALIIILCFILSIVIIACSVFAILYFSGKSQFNQDDVKINLPTDVQAEQDGTIVSYKGKKYKYDNDINTILCIGVDKDTTEQEKADAYGKAGQADALYLVCIDNEEKKYTVISINRDSIIDIDVYDTAGHFVGVTKNQACISYAYGDGKETSCENTVNAISRMLYNIPINTYFSINKACIPLINDIIGGVDVPVYDNDGNLTGETQYLTGNAAYKYIHDRDVTKLDSNVVRIKRQTSYIKAFAKKTIEQTKSDLSTPLDLFDTISIYSTTTLNASKITYLTTNALSDRNDINLEFKSIKGEVKLGKDNFTEFHIDNDSLLELVINVFYDEVK